MPYANIVSIVINGGTSRMRSILICLLFLLIACVMAWAQQEQQDLMSAAAEVEKALKDIGIEAAKAKFEELASQREGILFDVDEFISLGRQLVQTGRPSDAVHILELAAGAFEDSWILQQVLAQAYFADGDEAGSIEHAQKMREIRNRATLADFIAQNKGRLATSADEVVRRHIAAIGGEEAWRAINTMVVKFRVQGGGVDFRIVRMYKRPHFFRQGMEGGARFTATNGERVWSVGPNGWTQIQNNAYIRMASMSDGFIDYQQLGITYELIGLDIIDGSPVYQLKRTFSDGIEQDLFFSVESGLLIETLEEYVQGSPFIHSYKSHWNYRDVGGVKIPHVFIRNVGALGPPHGGVVEEVQINVPLDDALFVPPES